MSNNTFKKLRLILDANMLAYDHNKLALIADLAHRAGIDDYMTNLADYILCNFDYFCESEKFSPNHIDLMIAFCAYVSDDIMSFYEDSEYDDNTVKPTNELQRLFKYVKRYLKQHRKLNTKNLHEFNYKYDCQFNLNAYSKNVVFLKAFDCYGSWEVSQISGYHTGESRHVAKLVLTKLVKRSFDDADEQPTHKIIWTKLLTSNELSDIAKGSATNTLTFNIEDNSDEFMIYNVETDYPDAMGVINYKTLSRDKVISSILFDDHKNIQKINIFSDAKEAIERLAQ